MTDTILVIEDKESMLDMLKQTLEAESYRVILARDGAEGIKRLTDERIALVLTDLKLPKKDGFEVLKAVKEDNPLLPVIVMTAFGTIETAVKATKLGAYDYLLKPFDAPKLKQLDTNALKPARDLQLIDRLVIPAEGGEGAWGGEWWGWGELRRPGPAGGAGRAARGRGAGSLGIAQIQVLVRARPARRRGGPNPALDLAFGPTIRPEKASPNRTKIITCSRP